ncbi:MAG: O-antigen ligase family protein [Actinomycetota bacterium]
MSTFAPRPLIARTDVRVRRSSFPAVAVCALVFVSDFEYRQRDVNAALEGSIDFAIVFELLVYFGVAAIFFLGAAAPKARRLPPPLLIMWVFTVVLVISALWAPSMVFSAVRGSQHLILAVMATVFGRQADEHDFANIAGAYVGLMTGFIGLGLVWRIAPSNNVADRFNWGATHPVVAAALLVTSVLILMSWTRADTGYRPFRTSAVYLLLFVHVAALAATQTRGAIFAAIVGAIVWLALAVKRRQDLLIMAAFLAPVLGFLSRDVVLGLIVRGESIEQLQTLNSRTTLWAEAISAVGSNPILGRGYFSAREIFLESIGLGGAHNAYIEVLVSTGLVGVALLAALLLRMIRVLSAIRRTPQGPLIAAIFASLLANGLTAQYWAQGGTGSSVWFYVCIAWASAVWTQEMRREAETRRRAAATEGGIDLGSPQIQQPVSEPG